MAEVAIPLMAMGAMYIISNQNKEENFTVRNTSSQLPNTNPMVKNYPVLDKNAVKYETSAYRGANPDTDFKPYNPTSNVKAENSGKDFVSLSGNKMRPGELQHNNMVPYFGSSITQSTVGHEGLLDSYTGAGSQIIEKQSQAPLFKPRKDMNWTHGMPSTTDYMQDRMRNNVSSKMNNVKPWEEIRVGPGINKGFESKGSGGFNSSMDGREVWGPKTVDQLRAANNPKMSFKSQMLGGHVGRRGPRGIIGKQEKNRPDTYYIQSADRWLTTTGIEKAQTARSDHILKDENRQTTSKEFTGIATAENNGIRQRGHVEASDKPQFEGPDKYLGGVTRPNGQDVTTADYGKEGFTQVTNSRMLTSENNHLNGVARGVYAMMTPILDILRPTKKQNVIGNLRPSGNANATGQQQRIFNPNDTPVHTIREQTENTKFIKHGGRAYNLGHTTNEHQPVYGQRDTTTCSFYGNPGGKEGYGAKGKIYNSAYNANLNPNKQVISKVDRYNVGNHSLYNGNINVNLNSNKNIRPSRPLPNMPKSASNMSNLGVYSNKNTREVAQQCGRNSGDLLSPFKNNPYTHSLNSSV